MVCWIAFSGILCALPTYEVALQQRITIMAVEAGIPIRAGDLLSHVISVFLRRA